MISFSRRGQLERIEGMDGGFREYEEEIRTFVPSCAQEAQDQRLLLSYLQLFGTKLLTRDCAVAHLTASSMIFNRERDKVLMAYHKIYQSWSWTGGHADGERIPLLTAVREAMEETGLTEVDLIEEGVQGLEILPVWGHWKGGSYVSSHQHLNLSYLLEADERAKLQIKQDENSGVQWIPIERLREYVTEPDMIPVYEKLIAKGKV